MNDILVSARLIFGIFVFHCMRLLLLLLPYIFVRILFCLQFIRVRSLAMNFAAYTMLSYDTLFIHRCQYLWISNPKTVAIHLQTLKKLNKRFREKQKERERDRERCTAKENARIQSHIAQTPIFNWRFIGYDSWIAVGNGNEANVKCQYVNACTHAREWVRAVVRIVHCL